jgi:tRNA threonylcarbamoyl adenosine modification protein YjeE
VLLEGPLGAGKSTFARALLSALGVVQPAEGSPTFALAHEYESPRGGVVHVDFYRIRHEAEIQEAGLEAYFWERPLIVIAEWVSRFPEFEDAVVNRHPDGTPWRVTLSIAGETMRDVTITKR